jgi:exopolysaccharide biosynthesis operon protein EpsL
LPTATLTPVHADEFDAFNFQAAVNVVRDDNLFRTPDGSGQRPQMDTITSTILGVDFNKRFSLQQVIANVSWVDYHYAAHNYLDATALNYDGRWLWAAGSQLTGELSASRTEAPNSFAEVPEIRNSGQRNLRVSESQRFAMDYGLHPSWHVIGDVSHQDVKNEQVIFANGDSELFGAGVGVKYSPASGNWVSGQVRQTDGKYTNRPFDPVSKFDNKFTQPGLEFNMNWVLTGHSTVNGRLEYVHRKHEHFEDRDFSGWDGQLSYIYQYSAKTNVSIGYVRGLVPYQASDSSYYVSDGITLGSQWAATDKIAVGAHIGYAHRRYFGEVVPLTTARREDDATDGGVDITYKAARWLELKAGLLAEKRNSNQINFDFTDRRALLSANAFF